MTQVPLFTSFGQQNDSADKVVLSKSLYSLIVVLVLLVGLAVDKISSWLGKLPEIMEEYTMGSKAKQVLSGRSVRP